MKRYNISAPTPQGPAGRNQQAFILGMDFHEAAIRASETRTETSGRPVMALCPMIVAYAFSAELYLKALSPKPIKNHRLNVLFSRLDQHTRHTIDTNYLAISGRSLVELEMDLKELSNAFVEWRYIYEGDGLQVHTNLLIAFVKAVFLSIRALQSTWDVTQDAQARLTANEISPSMTVKNFGGGTFLHMVDGTGGTLNTPDAK